MSFYAATGNNLNGEQLTNQFDHTCVIQSIQPKAVFEVEITFLIS